MPFLAVGGLESPDCRLASSASRHQRTESILIIDEQYLGPFHTGLLPTDRADRSCSHRRAAEVRCSPAGRSRVKTVPSPRLAGNADAATMPTHDSPQRRQPETAPGEFCREKGVENFRERFRRSCRSRCRRPPTCTYRPGASVLTGVTGHRFHRQSCLRGGHLRADGDLTRHLVRPIAIGGVRQKVKDDLPQLHHVCFGSSAGKWGSRRIYDVNVLWMWRSSGVRSFP